MALDINQLRAAFSKRSESSDNQGGSNQWEKFYPFYKMEFDQVANFRFLPDLNEDNEYGFIVENKYHTLIVNGKKKRVGCLKMYDEECPCCEKSAYYYNKDSPEHDVVMGKKFWRQVEYIAQGLVISSPFDYPIKPDENPVRLIGMSNKVYQKVENSIVKGDLDDMPYDMELGYDFRIAKTKQGEYADYSNSDFARKSSAVPKNLLSRIELYNLADFRMPKVEREAMEAMITGSMHVDTVPTSSSSSTGSASLDAKMSSPKDSQDANALVSSTVADTTSVSPAKLSAQEILAKLKSRQNAS